MFFIAADDSTPESLLLMEGNVPQSFVSDVRDASGEYTVPCATLSALYIPLIFRLLHDLASTVPSSCQRRTQRYTVERLTPVCCEIAMAEAPLSHSHTIHLLEVTEAMYLVALWSIKA